MPEEENQSQEPEKTEASGGPIELEFEGFFGKEKVLWLEEGILCVPYVPDFKVEDLVFYFSPNPREPREIYHSLPLKALDRWSTYFTKKGWRFIHTRPEARNAEGPFKVLPGKVGIEILDSGRLFLPRPQFRFGPERKKFRVVSLEKRRPFDPWKPTYIRAVNFIKKYEWIRPMPRAVEYAIWEIEECGEVAGSVSWENAELILSNFSKDNEYVQEVLQDLFEKRPENFPLGSEVYLRILGRSGDGGFEKVCRLHKNPQRVKRRHVAVALGKLKRRESLDTLLNLLDDEDLEVREAALCSIGQVGTPKGSPAEEKIRHILEEAQKISHRVWAAEALLRGGDPSQEKLLIQFVKEMPYPLHDMGELGEILIDLKITQAVPFLINRSKSGRVELRDDAAEALRGLTGLDIQFHGHGDQLQRRDAIRRWTRWWEEHKRSRRKR